MNKCWKVDGNSAKYSSFDDAVAQAKKNVAKYADDYAIYELVAVAKAKVPDVEIVTVTA